MEQDGTVLLHSEGDRVISVTTGTVSRVTIRHTLEEAHTMLHQLRNAIMAAELANHGRS